MTTRDDINPADLIQFSEQELLTDPQYSEIFKKTRRGKVVINDIIEQRFGPVQFLELASPFDEKNEDLVTGIRNPDLLPLLGNTIKNYDQVKLVQTSNASFNKKINQFNTVFGPGGTIQEDLLASLARSRGIDQMPIGDLRREDIVPPQAQAPRRRGFGRGERPRARF